MNNKSAKTPELLLCPNVVVEVTKPLQIQDRSVRLGCATTTTTRSAGEPLCTLRASQDEETRLIEITATATTPTVQLSQLRLENGITIGAGEKALVLHMAQANCVSSRTQN